MRSGVPGNLPAAGASPRLCPHWKTRGRREGRTEERERGGERERRQGGWDGGREEGRDKWGRGQVSAHKQQQPGAEQVLFTYNKFFVSFNV